MDSLALGVATATLLFGWRVNTVFRLLFFRTPLIPLFTSGVKWYFYLRGFSKGMMRKIIRLDTSSEATNRHGLEVIGTTFGFFRMSTT